MNIASNDLEYYKMPFLYLVFSYVRNQAIDWADKNYVFVSKQKTGSWMVYKFVMAS